MRWFGGRGGGGVGGVIKYCWGALGTGHFIYNTGDRPQSEMSFTLLKSLNLDLLKDLQ